jgi:hypothetical protein
MRLAGTASLTGRRDASRLLADASLAIQQALGVVAEPLLLRPGVDSLLARARPSSLVVVGLSDRWRTEGLGPARARLARQAPAGLVVTRRGLRPGALAPRDSLTRYTWSLGLGQPPTAR